MSDNAARTLQVLGAGCPKCGRLADAAEEAAISLGIDYKLEKVTDIVAIMSSGVMMTPALVVDGKVKVSGRVPSVDELRKILAE
jgi:small redox-active disulfide protein 2